MNTRILLTLLCAWTLCGSASAGTCKIKTGGYTLGGDYAGDFLSDETKGILQGMGYTLDPKFQDDEVDFILRYDLGTAVWRGVFNFAEFQMWDVANRERPIFGTEERSKANQGWDALRAKVDKKANKKIKKLIPPCGR